MKCKQSLALLLAGAMLLPANAFAADLSQFKDFPNDWSSQSLERAIDDGLLNGSNGQINAKGLLTRAQMAAIVARAFGAVKTASLSSYKDVLPSAWYYSDMGKAVQMQAFQGADGLLHPNDPITREEAFTVLARAFALADGSSSALSAFSDSASVSSWAKGSVAALVENGYVDGANGRLNPKNNITRAEFAKVITGMAATYVGSETVSGKTVDGNVIVRESGASLSNVTINGDLIIADSADKVSLENVKVTGRIVIRGGASSVSATNTTAGKGVLVDSPNGSASLSVSGGSIGTVNVKSDLSLSDTVSNVTITDKATLTVEKDAKVDTVTVSAAGAKVTGSGKVDTVKANANNVTVSTSGTKVTAGSGVSGVKAGDKTVEAGKTETVGTASTSTGGSSGGGSHSSSSRYTYVLMNIPYDEFYKAEITNEKSVDAVTSATKSKPRSTLVAGSYHVNEDGSDISGVIYPVRVKNSDLSGLTKITDSDSKTITVNMRGQETTTEYKGKDALFESASHSYYVLNETPSSYKELTVAEDGSFTFSKVTGTATEISDATATISDSSAYGDYQITLSGNSVSSLGTVYGVVLNTKEGSSYGLRHLENIWLNTNLAFSTGFTTSSHNSPLSAEHYKAIMGQHINSITYYTSTGIKNIAVDLYVPIKFEHTLTVANAQVTANETTVNISGLPNDFTQSVTVPKGMTYTDGKLKWTDAQPGSYTLTISDTNHKYSSVSADFVLSTTTAVAGYNDTTKSLIQASGATEADFANYLKNITSVKIGDKTYNAAGRGAVKIIKADGAIDEDVKANGEALFADGQTRTLVISATGYPDLTVTYTPTYTYAYAAVPYSEYWENEGVYLKEGANWDDSSTEVDNDSYKYGSVLLSEHDKGAFDAVSRATARHGIHRGSFQQQQIFQTTEGVDLTVAYWNSATSLVLADGSEATFAGTSESDYTSTDQPLATITVGEGENAHTYHMTGSILKGIRYVPVKVKTSDFKDFKQEYTVVENGGALTGGYTEGKLVGFHGDTALTAAVTANTNGLKTVTKNSDDSFSFSARQTGSDSGIKNTELKTVDKSKIVVTPQKYSGTYGESLRVHLTGDAYGDLGSRMQTVEWKFYGATNPDEDTSAKPLATYGTKFAADDWMHKGQGIQLGLTDSERCNISELENHGAGYWTATIYALGYHDFTITVNVTAKNLPGYVEPMTDEQKNTLTDLAAKANKYLNDKNTKYPTNGVTAAVLKEHADQATSMANDATTSKEAAAGLIKELKDYLDEMDAANASTEPTTKAVDGSATVEIYGYSAQVTVTYDPTTGKITEVKDNQTAAGTNSSFWDSATAMFAKFLNKTKDEVSAMNTTDPNGEKFDAVSGATYSSDAIRRAVVDALSND